MTGPNENITKIKKPVVEFRHKEKESTMEERSQLKIQNEPLRSQVMAVTEDGECSEKVGRPFLEPKKKENARVRFGE